MHGTITGKVVKASDEHRLQMARDDFWHFRTLIHPKMLQGWFQHDAGQHLQKFYNDLVAGKRPKLLLSTPPQHGKSMMMADFIAWVAGQLPDLHAMFASYSDALGERTNSDLQRIYDSEAYQRCFYDTRIPERANVTSETRYKRNASYMQYVNHDGDFRNTTVQGQITGFGLDLGVIDDPIKGRAEASSLANRDKTWNWLTDDFFSRFSDQAGMVMIGTRWHLDDPLGRWIERFPETTILNYSAIAEEDELYRKKGVPLFEEHKSLPFLMERKKLYTRGAWESLYQGHPIVVGGGIFPIEYLTTLNMLDRSKITASVRSWDKAGTKDGGAAQNQA